ncbi:hypothetical protein [Flavobacterium sp.]|uniref:hypothetical protein n=1 Tax=Flavobacterium sp. TaxID=239 RepID=UPI00286E7B56|nr:hypothetical protein [Flavobacterium sp.]
MKLIKYLLLALLFINCRQEKTENNRVKEIEGVSNEVLNSDTAYSDESLDALLKCGEYSLMDDYFTVPDNGCIYAPSTINKLGNVEVYLIPKTNLNDAIDVEKEEAKINIMNIADLKKNYNIYILVIDKKYLTHNQNMDIPYYPSLPYEQIVFKYENGIWEKTNILNLKEGNDSEYNNWKKKNLVKSQFVGDNKSLELKGDYFIKTKVSSVETGDPIDVKFYFNFETSTATLSIGSDNSLEAYCEGTYSINKNNDNLKLEYTDEGTCPSDKDESSFLIKEENNQYYIKSKRFYDFDWKILKLKE